MIDFRYLTTRPNVEETVAHFELVIYGLSVGGIVVLSVKVVVDFFFIQMIQFLKNQNKLKGEGRNYINKNFTLSNALAKFSNLGFLLTSCCCVLVTKG